MDHHVWLFSVLSGTLLVSGSCVLPILWRGSSEADRQRALKADMSQGKGGAALMTTTLLPNSSM